MSETITPDEDSGAIGEDGALDEVASDGGDEASSDVATSDAATDGGTKTGFVHPGILVQKTQLDFVKAKIAAGTAPWATAFAAAKSSRFGSLSYKATPRAIVECGSYSMPDNGCSDEKDDVTAAYTHALLFHFTGDESYAKKSIEIMNAWSAVLTDHTNSNAPLQSAWCGSVFPRAAELIRADYGKWADADVARFSKMMKDVYLPKVIKGSTSNGNWELSMIEASIAIGVFLDDKATFDAAVKMWRKRVPAYLYLTSDGASPVTPPGTTKSGAALTTYWYDPGKFVDGLCQETCRDFGHTQLGLAAMINAAETAHIQGVDLYGEEADRIATGLEWNAQWLDGVAPPSWLCGGKLTDANATEMWEIALNEFETRLKKAMPHTKSVAGKVRPTKTNHHMIWETLTHYGVGM
ncbi:MAG: alginate lyase family protein [Polyangiales bacterium]